MDNIYFCQFSNFVGNNIYLPYTVGSIISYIKTNKDIVDNYNIDIIFLKETVKLNNPKFVFISVYMWNFKYSMSFAKKVKEEFSDCKIIIGGHHVPYFDHNFFKEHPYVDILVHGEGEKACEEILTKDCFYNIHNLSINKLGETIRTKKHYDNCDLDMIPSVYLSGIFDELLKLPYSFTSSLETNRGCPYGCKYCDWGSNMTSQKKLRFFSKEKVFKEIEWIGKNKIDFVFGTDSNFGIIKEDIDYINKIIEVKKEYGYPNKFRVCYAKNSDDLIFEMNKRLNEYDLSKGATLSFQTLNIKSSNAVGRKNMSLTKFKELVKKYESEKIPTYTEIILGLPEETYDSFANGLCTLLDYGQHSSIVVYNCQVYPNNEMNTSDFRKKYNIETVKIPMYPTHTIIKNNDNIDEEEIVIATSTMDKEEWVKSCMFSWAVQTFHCLGLLQLVSRFLKEKNIISYRGFYEKLLKYAENNPDTIIGKEYYKIRNKYYDVQNKGKGFEYINKPFGELNWTFEEGSFLTFILNANEFYMDISNALTGITYKEELSQLVNFNKLMLKEPFKTSVVRNTEKTKDILKHFGYKTGKCDYFKIEQNKSYESLQDYATKVIWYGRKGGEFLHDLSEIKER